MASEKPQDECPRCGGGSGYSGAATASQTVHGRWGYKPELNDVIHGTLRWSLMTCNECGFQFRLDAPSREDWEYER